jgi:phosphatidylserine/phosphatidylglycerophosphate/cardiolipin synthase-like enzyme
VATYEIDDPRIVRALLDAHERGIAVRLLLDEARDANTETVATLRAAGLDVRDGPDAFRHYHPKVIVVDETRAVVMSANLNTYSMETERNHGVILDDPFDVADLVDVFEHDFEDLPGDPAAVTCTRLVLSPHNARRRLLSLIASAESRLSVQHLSMTDAEVRQAIGQMAMRGVDTRVILADPAWIETNTEAATALRALGAQVRFLSVPENHAKLIVADDAALVGSENLSWTSLESNREVGVVLTDTGAVEPLRTAFDLDWDAATP